MTRADCIDGPRPCRIRECRYHLGGRSKHRPTCVLDEADRDGMSAYEVARVMGVSRERIEQVERRALVRLKTKREALIARECVE